MQKRVEKELKTNELWQIHGKYYDLKPFLNRHPGGKRMALLGQGKDATALFESTHLFKKIPLGYLKSFYVGDVPNYKPEFSFKENGFYETLRGRVQDHFREQAEKKGMKHGFETKIAHGTPAFFFRLAVIYALFLSVSYLAIVEGSLLAAALWAFVAFPLGGYGHESLHGGVFAKPWKNRLLALCSMDMLGISSYVYTHVHSVNHHIYPNLVKKDPDIEIHYPFIREFKYQKRRWIHGFQQVYMWLKYFVSLPLANIMDFDTVLRGRWGMVTLAKPYFAEAVYFWITKAFNISILYVLPHLLHSTGTALLINVLMVGIASFFTNLNFALNHQNDDVMDVIQNPPKTDEPIDWGELQVRTACDYQHGHWFWDTMFSGLNHQIEHHLFPLISYCKLPEIVPIVRKTCSEFGIPYYYHKSYFHALVAHFKFVKRMGSTEVPQVALDPVPVKT